MAITRAKTIAEYSIVKWLIAQNLALECFTLTMSGNEGTLEDKFGESMVLVYDPDEKSVYIKEQ